jgi:hypothetical protein
MVVVSWYRPSTSREDPKMAKKRTSFERWRLKIQLGVKARILHIHMYLYIYQRLNEVSKPASSALGQEIEIMKYIGSCMKPLIS